MTHRSWTVRMLAVPSAIWVAFGCGLAVQTRNPLLALMLIGILPLGLLWGLFWFVANLLGKDEHPPARAAMAMSMCDPPADNSAGLPAANQTLSAHVGGSGPPVAPGPWRRYIARSLDLLPWSFVLGFAVGLFNTMVGTHLMHFPWPHVVSSTVSGLIYLPFVLLIDALVYAACGNGVGKALLGIRVLELDGTRPSFGRYMRRNYSIWVRGLAFGFPVARQLAMLVSYLVLKREGEAAWDASLKFRVVRETCTPAHYALVLLLSVILLVAAVYGQRMQHATGHAVHVGTSEHSSTYTARSPAGGSRNNIDLQGMNGQAVRPC